MLEKTIRRLKEIDRLLAISILRQQGFNWRKIQQLLGSNSRNLPYNKLLSQEQINARLLRLMQSGVIDLSEYTAIIQQDQKRNQKRGRPGRPPALTDDHIRTLQALLADPATQHLPYTQIYKLFAAQASNPPGYHTVYRYLREMPDLFKRKKRQRYLHAYHPANVLPGEVWLIDRFRADIFVVDPITGEYARPECIAVIDKATRAILAIGAAYRPNETTTRKRFHFDAHLAGVAILEAIRGELTGVPHFPQKILIDFGKVEGAQRIIDYLSYHGVIVEKARPYTPHDKAEIEGGVIAHIHTQLEAHLPGYCGSDNRPDAQPACWDGKPRRHLIKGTVSYTDAAGRPLLDIDEFNAELRAFAKQWNAQAASGDIRYRNIPRLARLQHATANNEIHSRLQYAETYLLPGATRTVYEDGTIQIYGRRYYHPALVALRAIYGADAKVYARYSLTNRHIVYLYRIDPNNPHAIPTEWLWHYDNPQTPSEHPWYRSQATWYNRDEHREGDPCHDAWIRLTRAVNQAARRAINEVRQNPIPDHRLLFNYIAANIWHAVETHLPNLLQSQPLNTPSPFTESGTRDEVLQGVEAGAASKDGNPTGQRTDARPALINAHPHNHPCPPLPLGEGQGARAETPDIDLWEIEKRYMQSIRQRAERWRNKYWR